MRRRGQQGDSPTMTSPACSACPACCEAGRGVTSTQRTAIALEFPIGAQLIGTGESPWASKLLTFDSTVYVTWI